VRKFSTFTEDLLAAADAPQTTHMVVRLSCSSVLFRLPWWSSEFEVEPVPPDAYRERS
jgi:hypothetical protein